MYSIDIKEPTTKKKYQELVTIIINSYDANVLKTTILYFNKFFEKNYAKFENSTAEVRKLLKSTSQTKQSIAERYALFLINEELFRDFMSFLPDTSAKMFEYLAFNFKNDSESIEKKLKIKLNITKEKNSNWSTFHTYIVPKELFFFKDMAYTNFSSNPIFYLSLPLGIAVHIQAYFPKPDDYDFVPVKNIPQALILFEDNDRIINVLNDLFAYFSIESNKIDTTKKIKQGQASKVCKIFSINEFYQTDEKELNFVRTNFLMRLANLNLSIRNIQTSPQDNIKQLIIRILEGGFSIANGLMLWANGTSKLTDSSKDIIFFKRITEYLAKIPAQEWISYENFESYLTYRNEYKPAYSYYESDKIYYTVEPRDTTKFYNDNRQDISQKNFLDILIYQPHKGTIFLLASLGILDIAYKIPDYSELGYSVFSPYDELKYFRITPLGAYCLGITQSYTPKVEIAKKGFDLDTENLFIVLNENCTPSQETILKEVGEKISYNRYKVSPASFMHSCDSVRKIDDKIQFFNTFVDENPPKIWSDFFNIIKANTNPMKRIDNITIYKISAENKNLISLLASNADIRKLISIGDNYRILIEKTNLTKFKTLLKEFGYFLE